MSFLEILTVLVTIIIESVCISFLMTAILTLINKSNMAYINTRSFIKFWLVNIIAFTINRIIHIVLPEFNYVKSIVFTIVCSVSACVFYNSKVLKGVIASISCLILSAIFEIIIVLILQSFSITPEAIISNVYYTGLYACGLAIFECLLAIGIHIYSSSLSSVDNKLQYFLPQLIAIIICMFPTMAILMFNYFEHSALFIIINLLQLLVMMFVGIYNLRFVAKHENTEQELANTIIHNETLSKVNEGVRGFKHDMGNIVQAILGYIAINDAEGAKQYCQNLVIGFNDINILSILSPKVIDDPAIYGVVVNKILMARDKNMTLSLDISTSIANINFPKFELSRILGILLDNAIEAGEQTNNKKLILNIHHDSARNSDVIVVSNSIADTNINIEKLFNKNYSTKKNPSGFGLYEVRKFLNKRPQSYIVTTINKEDKLFTQTITIDSIASKTNDENINKMQSTVA